ncbi:Alpha-galactosidase [Orbilia brochopaga]|nr:Alpha-galactosidase [Drechslerella brochopaga]
MARKTRSSVLVAAILAATVQCLEIKNTDEGRLPAMGFNSWNCFFEDINEEKFLTAAREIVDSGLREVGYTYVNIDDGWSDKQVWRDKDNRIAVDYQKFPDGISGLADKVHGMGLKLGIYSDRGTRTCASYPGSMDYEEIDAKTFSDWGIDYLKYDNCHFPSEEEDQYRWAPEWWSPMQEYVPSIYTTCAHQHRGAFNDIRTGPAPAGYDYSTSRSAERYRMMRDALSKQERVIQFGLCNWGHAHVEKWGNETGQSWRIWGDIRPTWTGNKDFINWGIMPILNHALFFVLNTTNFWGHADMDMLEVGNGLTDAEDRSHFALWAILKSPLLIGTPLDKISPAALETLKNKELIAFNQDPVFGGPAQPYKWGINPDWTWNQTHPAEYYSGNSTLGLHVFMLNTLDHVDLKRVDFTEVAGLDATKQYTVHDMWTGKDIGVFSKFFATAVDSHDIACLRFNEYRGEEKPAPVRRSHMGVKKEDL